MKMLLAVALMLALCACSNSNDATKALTDQGFTNVQTHGWAGPWACSDDDFYATSFTATNPLGKQVSGTACSGFVFKNTTIRW